MKSQTLHVFGIVVQADRRSSAHTASSSLTRSMTCGAAACCGGGLRDQQRIATWLERTRRTSNFTRATRDRGTPDSAAPGRSRREACVP